MDRLALRPLGAADPADRWVRWVHVSELPDPPFLRGGELLLLAGTGFRPADSDEYVRRLSDARVVAVGFGVTPVFDAVPPQLVAACDRHDMALLEVPPHVPFASIVELHHAELVRAETRDLKRLSDGQGLLIRAAAGPGPLRAVVERLAELLDGWVLVVDRNRDRTWSGGPVRRDPEVAEALERACASRSPWSAAFTAAEENVEVQRLLGPAPAGYAVAIARRTPFTVADRGLVGVAASALSLLFTAPSAASSPEALGAAVVTGLLRLPTLARGLAAPLDLAEDVPWRLVRGLLGEPPGSRETITQRLSVLLDTPFVEQDDDTFVAILPDDRPTGELLRAVDDAGLLAGISRPHPAADLDPAWGEAGSALDGARIRGRSVVAGADPQGLLALLDTPQASRYADRLLAGLDAGTPKDSALLLGTLRSWLAHNGSWDRTAADLGVHRNTVRHRMRQITRLLDRDLTDPDVRMELWFALRRRSEARLCRRDDPYNGGAGLGRNVHFCRERPLPSVCLPWTPEADGPCQHPQAPTAWRRTRWGRRTSSSRSWRPWRP
ncbi:PucR family transcriptional regulator [Actinoallomurus iriomotensis]|uniref:PucR family transcriptional regulator n=1 Tax=Actinoallomurus iriomotensis TaxID=478107 RepID=A0A9W6RSP4_9ACTN|nr:PucR family transcriptional regulator [Actinoallomurus iriomotensis]